MNIKLLMLVCKVINFNNKMFDCIYCFQIIKWSHFSDLETKWRPAKEKMFLLFSGLSEKFRMLQLRI